MRTKQEPRPAYHRRNDLRRLQELALPLPILVVDAGHHYEVRLLDAARAPADYPVLQHGRYEVICAYLAGWTHARELGP